MLNIKSLSLTVGLNPLLSWILIGSKHVLPCEVYKVFVKSAEADCELANSVLSSRKKTGAGVIVVLVKFDHKVSIYCTWDQCRGEALRSRI